MTAALRPGQRVLVRGQWLGTVVGDNHDGRVFVALDSGCSAAYLPDDLQTLTDSGRQWPPPLETKTRQAGGDP